MDLVTNPVSNDNSFLDETNIKSENIGSEHIKQFDYLFKNGVIKNSVSKTTPLIYKGFKMTFEDIEIHKPYQAYNNKVSEARLFPKECREQNLTYGGRTFLKVKLEYNGRVLCSEYKYAGIFPIMIKSDMCHLKNAKNLYELGEDPGEPGGYFIVSGYDKMFRFHVLQKRNYLFAIKRKSKDAAYSDYSISIRSVGEDEIGQKNEIRYCLDGNIHLKLYLNKKIYLIPIVLILMALKDTSDMEIYKLIGSDERILIALAKMKELDVFSKKEALEYLGNRFYPIIRIENKEECGKELLRRILLVHINNNKDKFNLLIEGVKKLLRVYDEKVHVDDVDNPSNFELLTECQIIPLCIREKLEEIKKTFLIKVLNILRNRISTNDSTTSLNMSELMEITEECGEAQLEKVKKIFGLLDFDIGSKLKKLFSTGSITTNSCSDIMQNNGFTILAERINFWRFSSHFQSVSRGAFFSTLKITTIRKLRPEGWGFFCPLNTPDGSPCGLLTHLARSCVLSDKSLQIDESIFYTFGVCLPLGYNINTPVFYNGKLMGYTSNGSDLATKLREYRCLNGLCFEISHPHGEGIDEVIYVFDSVSGLFRQVYNSKMCKNEWIGIKEQVFLNIQLAKYITDDGFNDYDRIIKNSEDETKKVISGYGKDHHISYHYHELDNLNMFSSIASCIPFSDHNPSPRNIYQCQMAKQAMGIAAFNPQFRTDNKTFSVNYLQSPLVRTKGYSTFEDYPIGFNCMVAVLSYTAYDMEDAVVINKSANQRGLFSAFIYKNEKFDLEKDSFIQYLPNKGTKIHTDDILVKYYHPDIGFKTMKYSGSETGYIDTVRVFQNENPSVTITIRITRTSDIGDKFCSRHGQKGVCSMLWPDVDMPFTESGMRPDIIINPHAFPSRMTIGMLLESMCGKTAVELGKIQDATPFVKNTYFNEEDDAPGNIGEELKKCGFNYYGNEPMYSGITGTEFQTDIFMGTVYYQRLRHMVNDKYQVRTSGAVVATTHQPVGGRKNKGGIRFGEMEKDALIAHGSSYALRDRLMDCSDRTEFIYCGDCQSILFTLKSNCVCGSSNLKKTVMPYVFKYLCCELLAMNIKVKVDA